MTNSAELAANLKRSIRRHNVPGASVAVLKGSRVVATAAARRHQPRYAGAGHARRRVPDRLDHESIHRDADHAARRRRSAVARHADRRVPAGVSDCRPGYAPQRDGATSAEPYVRHRRRLLRRFGPRRRCHRAAHADDDAAADPVPARHEDVVLQRRVCGARAPRRGVAARNVRPRDAPSHFQTARHETGHDVGRRRVAPSLRRWAHRRPERPETAARRFRSPIFRTA